MYVPERFLSILPTERGDERVQVCEFADTTFSKGLPMEANQPARQEISKRQMERDGRGSVR